jgi:protein-S-isoprenylcysteine O-methyltransferase Ste14
MFDEVRRSLNSVKLILVLSILVFIMTFNQITISGLPLMLVGIIIYVYHMGVQFALWGSQKKESNTHIKDGLYRYIRHPVYLSILLIHFGVSMSISSLLFTLYSVLLVFPYLYLRASFEDKVLCEKLPAYADSMKRTKMFIPKML